MPVSALPAPPAIAAGNLPGADQNPRDREGAPDFEDLTLPYGVLLIESQRLMGEFQYSCDIFRYYASDRRA